MRFCANARPDGREHDREPRARTANTSQSGGPSTILAVREVPARSALSRTAGQSDRGDRSSGQNRGTTWRFSG